MPIAVEFEIAKLRADLVDDAAATWSDDDLLECLNEAVRATCAVRPTAYPVTQPLELVAGTVQNLPDTATQLFDIIENVAPPQRVINQVDQSLLDESYRYWPGGARVAEVKHFSADPRDKRSFRVYPPNDGNGEVLANFGDTPTMTLSDVLPLADEYEPALYARALGEAYRRNTQRQDLAKTQGYVAQWGQLMGLGTQATAAAAPKVAVSEGKA